MHLQSPIDRPAVLAYIREKLLLQGKRSINVMFNKLDVCAYHSTDGGKCAVGWLIDDDKYRKDMEGRGVSHQFVEPLGWDLTDSDIDFLRSIQVIHDECEPDTWDEYLTMKTVNQIMERGYE